MPRRPREDAPGMLHHVWGRGIARRTAHESRKDARYLLARLALEVRAGRIEIIAFSILTTHFHLLVRSRTGELHVAMKHVLSPYVRRFNWRRERDGSLYGSRYNSRPVKDFRYLSILIRYIDQNASEAQIRKSKVALAPWQYPFCSAWYYAKKRRPLWLNTGWVDDTAGNPRPEERRDAYVHAFGSRLRVVDARVVEARMKHPSTDDDEFDDLVGAAPAHLQSWMERQARLADGTRPGLPYADVRRVVRLLDFLQRKLGTWKLVTAGSRRRDAWPVLRIGLLRDLAGLNYTQLGHSVGCSPSGVQRRVLQHKDLVQHNEEYARRAAWIAARCLAPSRGATRGIGVRREPSR